MSSFLAFGKDYVASNYKKAGDPVYLHIQQTKKPIPKARFPFLDEDVIKSLLELPMWEIAELDEPAGRDCLALKEHLFYTKESFRFNELAISDIQFGSRIARESN
ncbi:uncharacterized protein A4U43_C06F17750 [Asparagus officinalis]|uniref:Ubiquitinyl hydrolase variant UBP zinc finger domain-containing protein n=1 Tax=Asparagus officinalis TaxID=4686 RepID=A0A5P1EQ07_ASPOF|nr:uncharacterized protein A4U43_C06F17750 [Asparagus officinalis]